MIITDRTTENSQARKNRSFSKFTEKPVELRIRDFDPGVLLRYETIAKEKGMTRNEYISLVLEQLAYSPEIDRIDERYHALTSSVLEALEHNSDELSRLRALIEQKF